MFDDVSRDHDMRLVGSCRTCIYANGIHSKTRTAWCKKQNLDMEWFDPFGVAVYGTREFSECIAYEHKDGVILDGVCTPRSAEVVSE